MKTKNKTVAYDLRASSFNWEIAPGKTIQAWGFNNQVPGPVLRANAGDTLVVRLINDLSEATTIHWHGIALPASMDGTDATQRPIEPGEVFEYRFVVPDAGTFSYHAPQNETVQMERGMYGALIVDGEADPVVDGERIFMIDDMKLDANNEFTKPTWFLPRMVERHDGRQGNTLLLNGKEDLVIDVHGGQTERWRFINSSSARYFRLYLGGRELKIIASDGGLLEHPVAVTEALITPGERVDIAVGPFTEGETFAVESLAYNRTTFLKSRRETFATVKVGERRSSLAHIPERLRTIEAIAGQDAAVTRKVVLSVDPRIRDQKDFRINNTVHGNDEPVMVGEVQIWEVANTSRMDHPFHLHGFFFQVIEENGKAPAYKAWKDTYDLKPRSTIKIAWMPDDRPGTWMYHCHIIEHHAAGMMAHFDVVDGRKPYAEKAPTHTHHPH
ncbi:MAG: multicopper oxidase family protein [Flavobacteriales bacterium]|nr:multicopper oxidase family protein [Flavobacteriales bacterium]